MQSRPLWSDEKALLSPIHRLIASGSFPNDSKPRFKVRRLGLGVRIRAKLASLVQES